ncbi:MAG: T9SS type A sorting domain-containing protein [Bacteroidota bacterium]
MRKYIVIFIFLINIQVNAQVLNVPEVIQEQNQWCWSGVSKCILDYYGYPQLQCDIAEYARIVITWTSFGTQNCCVNPNAGCNYWNYNWGAAGSIQDILIHFGNIQNYGVGSALSLSQINTEISINHPFVVRWGWTTGGGHFVVGHGVNGNDVNYMNPWFGEGLHVSTYSWLVNDGNHTWTHTNVLTTSPTAIEEPLEQINGSMIYPNPSEGEVKIRIPQIIQSEIKVSNQLGETVYHKLKNTLTNEPVLLDLHSLSKGIYFIAIKNNKGNVIEKLILQ